MTKKQEKPSQVHAIIRQAMAADLKWLSTTPNPQVAIDVRSAQIAHATQRIEQFEAEGTIS